jgi:hypothetical protein
MDAVGLIRKQGWEWRPDGLGHGLGPGVVMRVQGKQKAFVPLHRVWGIFDQELQRVGCPSSESVGAPFSVGGFFSFVKKVASAPVKAVTKTVAKVVPKKVTQAIKSATSKVTALAKKATATVLKASLAPSQFVTSKLAKIPILGGVAQAANRLANLPTQAALQLAQGKRIDQAAIGTFKQALADTKTLAPYIQTVVSFVPGIGTGLSAGIGGALALAQGKRIDQAFIEAAKSAIPGGPIAQMAFSVATDAIQGKPIDQIALNALPISPEAKKYLAAGIGAAKDLAHGKSVSQALIDNATRMLPPQLQKAVQVGVAIGHAKNIQSGLVAAAEGAASLANVQAKGLAAAKQFAAGVRTPAVVNALHQAEAAKQALTHVVEQAQNGHPQARNVVNALQANRLPAFAPRALPRALPAGLPRFPGMPARAPALPRFPFGAMPRFA